MSELNWTNLQMFRQNYGQPTVLLTAPRRLPALLLLFLASGCAALIFEVTWLQLLQLVIGSSAVSVGVLLATYMGGMCLGALAAPRIFSSARHPLRVYAALELAIGVIGVVELFAIPLVGRVYSAQIGYGLPGFLLRGLVCGICVLPPTVLMGATLPLVARWLGATPKGVSGVGLLYSANTAGAVLGCLLAGFYLLRVYDMAIATLVAAALDGLVAASALVLSILKPHGRPSDDSNQILTARVPRSWAVYLAIGLSGCTALGAEVVWTRLLSLLLGGTVYTFSIILAVFLLGLAIGSCAAAVLSQRVGRPRLMLGCCQLLLTVAIAWAAYIVGRILPYGQIERAATGSPWVVFEFQMLRSLLAILPAAILWGASFPLALATIAVSRGDPARTVAETYAANTIGAIVGALTTSLWLIPLFGTQRAQQLFIGLSAVAACLALISPALGPRPGTVPLGDATRLTPWNLGPAVLAASSGIAALLAWSVAPIPEMTIAYGRAAASWIGHAQIVYAGEGMNSSVAVTSSPSGSLKFHVSGKVEASTELMDMRLQLMLGHLPALVHRNPRSVLVVGMGSGVTAGSMVPYPEIERIVVAEIEPLVPMVVSRYFARYNNNVVRDPRVEIVYDDARHYVLTTTEKFDIITTDPIHPWVKGSAALYTKEYFELLARRLNPDGVVAQWVPLYESSPDVVKSEIATFLDVFPQGTVWDNGIGYDIVLLGQTDGATIDVDRMQRRLDRGDHALAMESLRDVRFGSAVDLLATYAGRASDLSPWLANAERNRDVNLRLQYIAGLGFTIRQRLQIYDQIMAFCRFPGDLFAASDDIKERLRKSLEMKQLLRKSLAQRRSKTQDEN
jgi:spermidine synthase